MSKKFYEMPRVTYEKKIPVDTLGAKLENEPRLEFTRVLYERFPQAEIYVVGGTVRDVMMGEQVSKDYDLVVRNVPANELQQALEKFGEVNLVGGRFGVFKLRLATDEPGVKNIEIALPRRETAAGTGGYRDFEIQSDPKLPIEEDLSRRDFTWNAMAWELREKRLVDPFEGILDIEERMVRAVGDPAERFGEDYSRMLRALRFAARFDFSIEKKTRDAIQKLGEHINDEAPRTYTSEDYGTETKIERVVPYEVISREFLKALYANPTRTIELYEEAGMLYRIMPELEPSKECDQPKEWHSEGTVWTHTKLALQRIQSPEFAAFFNGAKPSGEVIFAVLLHDIGKPKAKKTPERDGVPKTHFYGHDVMGAEIARALCKRLKVDSVEDLNVSTDRIEWLIRFHLFTLNVDLNKVKKSRLLHYFFNPKFPGEELLHLTFADASASIPEGKHPDLSNLEKLMGMLREMRSMQREKPESFKPLLNGEAIMRIKNMKPGPKIGAITRALQEAQLTGAVGTQEDAERFVKTFIPPENKEADAEL